MTEPDELNSFQKIGASLAASIRPSGFLPSQLAEQRFRIDSNIQADIFEATIEPYFLSFGGPTVNFLSKINTPSLILSLIHISEPTRRM